MFGSILALRHAQWHYRKPRYVQTKLPCRFYCRRRRPNPRRFTLHAIAAMLEDSVAFKKCNGQWPGVDKNGNKMSKRLAMPSRSVRNHPEIRRMLGPLVHMISECPTLGITLKFNTDGVVEVQLVFFGTYNTYSFFLRR